MDSKRLEPWASIVASKHAGIEVNGYIGSYTHALIGEMHLIERE